MAAQNSAVPNAEKHPRLTHTATQVQQCASVLLSCVSLSCSTVMLQEVQQRAPAFLCLCLQGAVKVLPVCFLVVRLLPVRLVTSISCDRIFLYSVDGFQ